MKLIEINEILRGNYTEKGIQKWWGRPRKILKGLTPEQVVEQNNPELTKKLESLVLGLKYGVFT